MVVGETLTDGDAVGAGVGDVDGAAVRAGVGDVDGAAVGAEVGDVEGAGVGEAVGLFSHSPGRVDSVTFSQADAALQQLFIPEGMALLFAAREQALSALHPFWMPAM